jgi:hypothetical protein
MAGSLATDSSRRPALRPEIRLVGNEPFGDSRPLAGPQRPRGQSDQGVATKTDRRRRCRGSRSRRGVDSEAKVETKEKVGRAQSVTTNGFSTLEDWQSGRLDGVRLPPTWGAALHMLSSVRCSFGDFDKLRSNHSSVAGKALQELGCVDLLPMPIPFPQVEDESARPIPPSNSKRRQRRFFVRQVGMQWTNKLVSFMSYTILGSRAFGLAKPSGRGGLSKLQSDLCNALFTFGYLAVGPPFKFFRRS